MPDRDPDQNPLNTSDASWPPAQVPQQQPPTAQVPHPDSDPMSTEPAGQDDRQAMPVDQEQPPRLAFPVVGIGASAGGLEAVTEFITAMRPDSGIAFVFIQHLPPERESMMADIL